MSALLLLAAAFALIIAVGSVAVVLNDAVEAWLQSAKERAAAGGGGFGSVAERARQPAMRAGDRGVPRLSAPAVQARDHGRVVERRRSVQGNASRVGGAR